MKNTFGSDLSLTIFGESRRGPGGRSLCGRLYGQTPRPGRRPVHSPHRGRRRAVFVRRSERLHHRHRHCADGGKPEHPQRRLCQDCRPAAPRPRRLHRLCQVPRVSGCAGRRALFRPGHRCPRGRWCRRAGCAEPGRYRHLHPYRRLRRHLRHPLRAGRCRCAGRTGGSPGRHTGGLCRAGPRRGGAHEGCHPRRRG